MVREPLVCEGPDLLPGHSMFLAAPPERAPPEIDDVVAEGHEGADVGRHRVVVDKLPSGK